MSGRFVDTNILLRHLLDDHPTHSPASTGLIGRIERGEEQGWMTDLVLAEAIWVLSNRQVRDLSRRDIADLLLPAIGLPNLDLPNKHLYPRIFDLYASSSIDYIDAFHAAQVEQADPPELYRFDLHFDGIPTVRRLEP